MNENILFKFVSLRPPSNQQASGEVTAATTIEAEDHANDFVIAVQNSKLKLLRDRLRAAAEIVGKKFILKNKDWVALYASNRTKSLFQGNVENFSEWSATVTDMLNEFGLKPDPAW